MANGQWREMMAKKRKIRSNIQGRFKAKRLVPAKSKTGKTAIARKGVK